jgi:hypothetical protein
MQLVCLGATDFWPQARPIALPRDPPPAENLQPVLSPCTL